MKNLVSLTVLALSLSACRGPAGSQGVPGTPGIQGPVGQDGTVIEIVQFCPGTTPSYPSTFPEIGEVINGRTYAVYSANGGFLTYLPPGTYNSNAIGSNCNFTIGTDGRLVQ